MALELHYGGAVSGSQRFSRPALEERLHRTMRSSNGVKMFGLRRIGKSTLKLCVIERLTRDNVPYAIFDGQGLNSLSDFMFQWLSAIPQQHRFIDKALALVGATPAKTIFEAWSKNTPVEEATLEAYWHLVANAISRAGQEKPLPVLIVDEFSMFMQNLVGKHGADKANRLLASMREWRGAGVKMLLTGSIGMKRLSREHGLNDEHLNDLQPFNVPELLEDEARVFIQSAPHATSWTEAHTNEVIKQSGVLYPCFLVKGLLELGTASPPQPQDFAAIFAERVRPHLHADFFNQFDRRLKAYKGIADSQLQALILPVLKAVMTADGPCTSRRLPEADATARKEVMEILVEDGFIDFTEDASFERHWKPASRLAKIWWMRSGLA